MLLALLSVFCRAVAGQVVVAARAAPTVTLNGATLTGVSSGSTNKFLGVPYAQPPYVTMSKLALVTFSFSSH